LPRANAGGYELEDMKVMALVRGIPHERFSELYWKLRPAQAA